MPEPIATPARSGSNPAPPSPESNHASWAAARANRMNRSRRRASLGWRSRTSTGARTSAAIRTGSWLASKWVIGPTPETPATADDHVEVTSPPSGVTQPRPVTTTRGRVARCGRMVSRLELFLQVRDGVSDGLNFFGVVVGDLDVEFFFHRHHELDDVERVRA